MPTLVKFGSGNDIQLEEDFDKVNSQLSSKGRTYSGSAVNGSWSIERTCSTSKTWKALATLRWLRMSTALDNGRRSPRKLLRAVVARLLGRKAWISRKRRSHAGAARVAARTRKVLRTVGVTPTPLI